MQLKTEHLVNLKENGKSLKTLFNHYGKLPKIKNGELPRKQKGKLPIPPIFLSVYSHPSRLVPQTDDNK